MQWPKGVLARHLLARDAPTAAELTNWLNETTELVTLLQAHVQAHDASRAEVT
jgi:hypothetical protein